MAEGKTLELSWEGIQLVWVVLGLFGAALGIGSMPPMTNKQCWVALGSGIIFGGFAPQWANWAFMHWVPGWMNPTGVPLPPFMMGSTAFVCGIGGMFLVPAILAFWRSPRQFISDAWDFVSVVKRGPK